MFDNYDNRWKCTEERLLKKSSAGISNLRFGVEETYHYEVDLKTGHLFSGIELSTIKKQP
jgi:hypothetical protein